MNSAELVRMIKDAVKPDQWEKQIAFLDANGTTYHIEAVEYDDNTEIVWVKGELAE